MTPPKRKQANVKDILKNPVSSQQPPLRFRREGLLGWLSYLGFSLLVVAPLGKFIADMISYISRRSMRTIEFPFYEQLGPSVTILFLIGFILTLIIIKKSRYAFPNIIPRIYGGILCISFVLLGYYYADMEMIALPSAVILVSTWMLFGIFYFHYFYRKSKDGYYLVWIKVLLFSFIPFLPLFFYTKEVADPIAGMAFGHYIKDPMQKRNRKITFLRR
ncbi:MAG: hypothetical protein IKS41_03240 [Alphaproteobacteria bacterium]|nr:hypothetical protein [Alphaproteobacteria bacterium]